MSVACQPTSYGESSVREVNVEEERRRGCHSGNVEDVESDISCVQEKKGSRAGLNVRSSDK